jgi:putative flippase GtrA
MEIAFPRLNKLIIYHFIAFALIGSVGTAVHYSILVLLVQFYYTSPVIASTIGFVGGAVTNYLLNYYLNFKSKKGHIYVFPKFITIATAGIIINGLIMSLLLYSGLHYLLCQVISTLMVLVWNFVCNYLWSFK